MRFASIVLAVGLAASSRRDRRRSETGPARRSGQTGTRQDDHRKGDRSGREAARRRGRARDPRCVQGPRLSRPRGPTCRSRSSSRPTPAGAFKLEGARPAR